METESLTDFHFSTTSTACPRCGRLTYPHVCEPIPPHGGDLAPIVAHEVQGRVTFEWIDAEGDEDV